MKKLMKALFAKVETSKDSKESKKGFTLVEMMVVVAIIAVLGAIAAPIFTGALDKTKAMASTESARITAENVETQAALDAIATDGTVVNP